MRRFFTILLCFIIVISICVSASVPGSALFVVDDALIASVAVSLAASVLLSIGISAVTGNESMYVSAARGIGYLVWEEMQREYSQAQLLSMIVIENGKAYFKCPENLFNRLKNWASNYNWSNFKVQTDISVSGVPEFSNSYPANSQYFAFDLMPSILTLNQGNSTIYYSPSSGFNFILNGDNTVFYYKDTYLTRSGYYGCISAFKPSSGVSFAGYLCNSSNPPAPVNNLSNATQFYYNRSYTSYGNSHNLITNQNNTNNYIGLPGSDVKHHTTYSGGKVYLDGSPIFSGATQGDWSIKCILAGCILVNIDNNIDYNNDGIKDFPINTDSSGSTIETPVDISVSAPSIPGNSIGSDQSLLVPIPSNIVDPSAPDLPLTQSTVKKRVKRGQTVAIVPDLPQLQDKTPQNLGVLVVNNTEIEDSVISPTLSTTYIGENSTTFVIIPDNPGSTPIPDSNDSPLVSSPYPDVINPGNEQITVTANNDVFPTVGETPSERPSVEVTDNAEIASSAVENISEIASEAVSDLAQPVGPGDVERNANRMKISAQLIHKFPFCIPYDFYNAVAQFSAPGEVIKFDIPFHIESLNFDYTFHIDLTQWEKVAQVSRWFFSVSWVVVLIMLTRKVIWK